MSNLVLFLEISENFRENHNSRPNTTARNEFKTSCRWHLREYFSKKNVVFGFTLNKKVLV
jgi:hypothetical protein